MNIHNLEQLFGTNLSNTRYQVRSQDPQVVQQQKELQTNIEQSFLPEIDPNEKPIQEITLECVNNLLQLYNINMQAELVHNHSDNQAYISLTDTENGNLVKKIKLADVIQMLAGQRIVNVSV